MDFAFNHPVVQPSSIRLMTIQSLKEDSSYSLLLVLPHDNILPFVSKYLNTKTWIMRFYFGFLILVSIGIIAWAAIDLKNDLIGFWSLLICFSLGAIPVFIPLIPLHEGLHGLAYKIVGAPKISFGANWRMFYFYAVADRFIANRKAFVFIALLPFIVINLSALIPLVYVSVSLKWLLLGVLFIHTTACAGDFAMLGFYESYRKASEVLTYDDVKEKRSYFYVRE